MDFQNANCWRSVAAIRLLTQKFTEPSATSEPLATGLLHQTLSLIVERGGDMPDATFELLSGPGPFAVTEAKDYVELLSHAKADCAAASTLDRRQPSMLIESAMGHRSCGGKSELLPRRLQEPS